MVLYMDKAPNPDAVSVGQWLREHRLDRGLTQQQVADQAGMKQPHLSELEQGLREGTLARVMRVGRALGGRVVVDLVEDPGAHNAPDLADVAPGEFYTNRTVDYSQTIVRRVPATTQA